MSEQPRLTDTKRAILTQSADVIGDGDAWTLDGGDVTADVLALLSDGALELEDHRYVRLTDAGRDVLWHDNPGHCPPPWGIDGPRPNGVGIVGSSGSVVAEVLDEDPVPRQDANARLIVRAPDMLARLQEVHAGLLTLNSAVGVLAQAVAETIAAATGSNL